MFVIPELNLFHSMRNKVISETDLLRSLKGPTAGRVVRALCDFRPPYGFAGPCLPLLGAADTVLTSSSRGLGARVMDLLGAMSWN